MTDIAAPLDDLRISLSEVDVLAALTRAAYDDADWMEPDPAVLDAVATLLGLIEKSSFAAMAAYHRLHGAIADAQPAPAGERWDGEGTAPGRDAELMKRDADLVGDSASALRRRLTPRPTTRSSAGTGSPAKTPTPRCYRSSSGTRRSWTGAKTTSSTRSSSTSAGTEAGAEPRRDHAGLVAAAGPPTRRHDGAHRELPLELHDTP